MEFFALLRNHLVMCGIEISRKSPKNHPFNVRNTTMLILLYLYVSLTIILLNEDNTFDECTDLLLRSVSISFYGVMYIIVVWNTSKLIKFVNRLADTVEASE